VKIIFDNSTPGPLARSLIGHEILTCPKLGWTRLENGELLTAAEAAGFELMITADQNLKYQQNLAKRRIALIVLGSNYWPTVRQFSALIAANADAAKPNSYVFIEMPATRKHGNSG
jgi:hypothetical protein